MFFSALFVKLFGNGMVYSVRAVWLTIYKKIAIFVWKFGQIYDANLEFHPRKYMKFFKKEKIYQKLGKVILELERNLEFPFNFSIKKSVTKRISNIVYLNKAI